MKKGVTSTLLYQCQEKTKVGYGTVLDLRDIKTKCNE